MAFILSPPLISASKKSSFIFHSSLAIIFIALPLCSCISTPECPPFNPCTLIFNPTRSSFASVYCRGSSIVELPPPALPIVITPKSSLSKFSIILPLRKSGSIAKAPVNPVSSSTVKRASIGPCFSFLSSSIDSIIAMPIPLSAPNVVPSALTLLPSTLTFMGSFEKSCSTSAFFSQTISMCP